MDNPSVIYKTVVPCPMFLPVSPALPASYPAFLDTIAFCLAFVFMILRIASPSTPLYSHQYKLPGVYGYPMSRSSSGFDQNKLITWQSSTCELFVAAKILKSFCFKQLQTLLAKHPGGGIHTARQQSVSASSSGVRNWSTPWQVAAYPAGCHNSTLRTTRLATRPCH